MVAWESNPTAGFLIADLGPYIGSDWPPTSPGLDHRFPADAGEIDYYVLDPAVDDYRTMGYTPSGPAWSDSYAYVRFDGTLRRAAYTDGSSSGPPSGAHIYVAWYDFDYNTVPAAPSVTPESLIPPSYTALGELGPLVTHWGPWITPPTQQWSAIPTGVGMSYRYTSSNVSMADALADPLATDYLGAPLSWVRDGSSGQFSYTAGSVAPSPASGTYSAENGFGAPGFYNATPTLPPDAVDIEHETVWNSHTQAAEMLASIVGDMQYTVSFEDRSAVSTPTDCTLYFWLEDPAHIVAGPDTTHGETRRTAGSPTQAELLTGYAARIGEVAFPASSHTTAAVTLALPTSAFFTGLLADRPDEAPGVYVNQAILEGSQGTDPPLPASGFVSGRQVFASGHSLTVTYQPPRYRFQLVGPETTSVIPPLRQWPRDDGLRRNPGRTTATSRQGSLRRGPRGTYT